VVGAETIVSGAPASTTTWANTLAFAGATLARLRRRRPHRESSAPLTVPEVVPLPDVGPIVLAEEDKIRQVVTNLVGNAMRFTPDDSPIEFAVEVDREGGFGQISIVDHGDGVPPQLREKIFQRFWRADTSRTRDTGGSGLGLAIVAGIVANHQGHVEVLETPGGGATFRVSLPLLLPSDTAAESTEAPAAEPKKRVRS
jgi:two-component system OmpR family sensor kinase